MSGHNRDPRLPKEKKPLSHGWIVAPSKTYPDRVYFYNIVTGCSTWNNPCEVSDGIDSKASSPSRVRKVKANTNSSEASHEKNPKKRKSTSRSPSASADSEIEDYDEEQDQYFDNIPISSFSLPHSKFTSPPSSPDSVSSFKTDPNDSEISEYNSLLENNEKQLWVHFATDPPKNNVKKSVALSDFNEPSTSVKKFGVEMTEGNKKKVHIPESFIKGHVSRKSEAFEKNRTGVIHKRKKSKKKKKNESPKKSIEESIIKSVSFKKRDKTPAQTQLLKLRKQNAEKLKELSIKHSNLLASKTCDKTSLSNCDIEGQSKSDNFSGTYFKRMDMSSNWVQEAEIYSKDEDTEEMDWEPSSEESDVWNINVFRQQLNKTNDSSSDIFDGLQFDNTLPLLSKTHSWFIVLDTNIFVSCLSFVKDLRDIKVPELGFPVIYVPWRVLQELDHLKDTKIYAVNRHLHGSVRRAIAYLNENFKMRHPRIFGQSFEDFEKMVGIETSAPDDQILQTCLQFQRQHPNIKLMLLTNDKNLESKAIVSSVEVYSKERFQKKYLNSGSVSPNFNVSSSEGTAFNNKESNRAEEIDKSLCEVKSILKDFLSLVVETEMKIAFEGDWVKLAFKKPPWNLQDVLECLLRHWRSVFFLVFSKETQSETQRLYERLFKKEAVSTEDVVDIISTMQRLILSIKKSQKKKRSYLDVVEATMTKLSNLLSSLSNQSSEVDSGVSPPLLSSAAPDSTLCSTQQVSQSEALNTDVARVKNLFKDIWDCLRNFCCSISDIVHSSGACDNAAVQEVRQKMSQIISEVSELVLIIEQVFEINPSDINEGHPLIIHLSNFLIRVYPAMQLDLQRDLPKCLSAFFTDFEGRSLLSSSLKDFKEFSHDLMNAVEYFNTHLMP